MANNMLIGYFIMGRSENSRNRVFVDGRGRNSDRGVRSGQAVRSILDYLFPGPRTGQTAPLSPTATRPTRFMISWRRAELLRMRFAPGPLNRTSPNYTPRISGIVTLSDGAFSYQLSILKSADGNPDSVQRFFFDYAQPRLPEKAILSIPTRAMATRSHPLRESRRR